MPGTSLLLLPLTKNKNALPFGLSYLSPIQSKSHRILQFYTPFLLSSHTKLEFRHVISLSSSSVTTIKSQNLIHTHFLIPSIVFVISLVFKLSSWIETYLKTEGCQLKLAPLQIAKNPGKQNKRNSGLLTVPVPILHISYKL